MSSCENGHHDDFSKLVNIFSATESESGVLFGMHFFAVPGSASHNEVDGELGMKGPPFENEIGRAHV